MAIPGQSSKVELLMPCKTATVATNASTYGYLDTIGWDHAQIVILTSGYTGAQALTDVFAEVLVVTEGTNSTAATAIVALTGGTSVVANSTGFTIPTYANSSTEGCVVVLDIDLTLRERYLRLQYNQGVKMTFAALAILSRGHVEPGSDDGSAALTHIA